MFHRFGPHSRAGSLFNVARTGGIGAFAVARFFWAGRRLPRHFAFIAILVVVFAVVAVWASWRYQYDGCVARRRRTATTTPTADRLPPTGIGGHGRHNPYCAQ